MPEVIIHKDEPTSEDSLDRDKYAEVFARLAETCETPMVIGLYGGWGIGKTSLMRQIQGKLDEDKARTVWFDPWRHQFDESSTVALLHTVVDTFELREEGKKLLMVIAAAFGSMLLKATTNLNWQDVDKFSKRLEEERFQVRDAQVRLHTHFEKLIEKARGEPAHRIVFFIDDLDRCLPAHTLTILEALKLYLNLPGCVYFVGVDREALERSIRHHYEDVALSETSYLDKIVQLPFTIPLIAPESMEKFVGPLLSEELKHCQPLLVKGLGDNPRQVKRFVNCLMLNHQLASSLEIPDYDPEILATLLLIQYRSVELYRLIARDLPLLLKLVHRCRQVIHPTAPQSRATPGSSLNHPSESVH
ncbi:MAG: AAA family ATPase [Proteobacteria bacterium]|nr:AAA family ATPase [Pseudomonadota bacterium]